MSSSVKAKTPTTEWSELRRIAAKSGGTRLSEALYGACGHCRLGWSDRLYRVENYLFGYCGTCDYWGVVGLHSETFAEQIFESDECEKFSAALSKLIDDTEDKDDVDVDADDDDAFVLRAHNVDVNALISRWRTAEMPARNAHVEETTTPAPVTFDPWPNAKRGGAVPVLDLLRPPDGWANLPLPLREKIGKLARLSVQPEARGLDTGSLALAHYTPMEGISLARELKARLAALNLWEPDEVVRAEWRDLNRRLSNDNDFSQFVAGAAITRYRALVATGAELRALLQTVESVTR